ncbi:hypothetical protein ABTJ37_20475, partial [Acinetobacter baumannii]
IENSFHTRIYIIPNPHMETPAYKIEKVRERDDTGGSRKASYNMVDVPELDVSFKQQSEKGEEEVPAVTVAAPIRPATLAFETQKEAKKPGLFK